MADQVAASLEITVEQLSADLTNADPGREITQVITTEVLRIARDICELRELAASGNGNGGADFGANDQSATRAVSPEADRNASLPASLVDAPQRFDPDDPPPGDNPDLDDLWLLCGDGEPLSCDRLLYESPADSDYEAFGFSCGGRENLDCDTLLGAVSGTNALVSPATAAPGNDAGLDRWWARCANGSSQACAQLVLTAPGGSLYAYYGYSCGGRTAGDCAALLGNDGSPPALEGRSPTDSAPGTDSYLDRLWLSCADLSATACGDLATFAPRSSDYERFGLSCGWRAVTPCTKLFAEITHCNITATCRTGARDG